MIEVALWTQCKSCGTNVLKIGFHVAVEAGPRKAAALSRWSTGQWSLVHNQLKMLHSIIQVRERLVHHIYGKLCVACIGIPQSTRDQS